MATKLVVEVREGHPLAEPLYAGGRVLVTPPLDEDFWLLRVKVSPKQAVVAFPKFGLLGMGFQVEKASWNTNLPWSVETEELYRHIRCNKGDNHIPKARCIEAIRLLQTTIRTNNFDAERNEWYDEAVRGA